MSNQTMTDAAWGAEYGRVGDYTSGPWTAHEGDRTGTLPCVLSDTVNAGGNFYVAQCNNYADAALIASAPEFIAALRMIADQTCDHGPQGVDCPRELARAVIQHYAQSIKVRA